MMLLFTDRSFGCVLSIILVLQRISHTRAHLRFWMVLSTFAFLPPQLIFLCTHTRAETCRTLTPTHPLCLCTRHMAALSNVQARISIHTYTHTHVHVYITSSYLISICSSLSIYFSVSLLIYLSIHSVYLYICPSSYLSNVYLFIWLSVYLPIFLSLSVHPCNCVFIHSCVCLYLFASVFVSVCLSV